VQSSAAYTATDSTGATGTFDGTVTYDAAGGYTITGT
jgi:hypothetical protein